MPIPEYLRQAVDQEIASFCAWRVPANALGGLCLVHNWQGDTVTISEKRPMVRNPSRWVNTPIAQFRYNQQEDDWSVYRADQNQRWLPDKGLHGVHFISSLLIYVNHDPEGVFWA